MKPHWDELAPADDIKAAREWFERANSADTALREAALAVWAVWYGGEMVRHAEVSSELLQWFRAEIAAKDMGALESLSQSLNEWRPLDVEEK
jgi:hypothetical protein